MPKLHIVAEDENIAEIAAQYGVAIARIWAHPDNAELRARREDGFNLDTGDELTVPDPVEGWKSAPTEARSRFRLLDTPVRFRLRLLDERGVPRTGLKWRLDVEGETHDGTLGRTAMIEAWVPASAKSARLTLDDQGIEEDFELEIDALSPIETEDGQNQRLHNLGFCRDQSPEDSDSALAEIMFADLVRQDGDEPRQRKLTDIYRDS